MERRQCRRAAVVELFRQENSKLEIVKILEETRDFVNRTVNKWYRTADIQDAKQSIRPRTALTPENRKIIARKIAYNPQRSMRKMARDLKISPVTMRRFVQKDLGMKSLKKVRVHHLNDKSEFIT